MHKDQPVDDGDNTSMELSNLPYLEPITEWPIQGMNSIVLSYAKNASLKVEITIETI